MISRPVKAETTEELQRSIDEVTRSVELDAVGSVARSRRLCIHLRLRDHFRLRLRVCVRLRLRVCVCAPSPSCVRARAEFACSSRAACSRALVCGNVGECVGGWVGHA